MISSLPMAFLVVAFRKSKLYEGPEENEHDNSLDLKKEENCEKKSNPLSENSGNQTNGKSILIVVVCYVLCISSEGFIICDQGL